MCPARFGVGNWKTVYGRHRIRGAPAAWRTADTSPDRPDGADDGERHNQSFARDGSGLRAVPGLAGVRRSRQKPQQAAGQGRGVGHLLGRLRAGCDQSKRTAWTVTVDAALIRAHQHSASGPSHSRVRHRPDPDRVYPGVGAFTGHQLGR
jgi:hypothetical protein